MKKGSVTAEAGYRFTHNGDLYKCVNANPTFQLEWVPGNGTAALYVRVDEAHAGTLADPIPYSGNMELESGKYYIQCRGESAWFGRRGRRCTGSAGFHGLSFRALLPPYAVLFHIYTAR